MNEINNENRFNILRGYYDKYGYHSQGGEALSIEQLYASLGFNSEEDFWQWYDFVPNKEELKGEWQCSGNCCHSILEQLSKMRKMSDKEYEEVRSRTKDNLDKLIFETEAKIHQAIRENDVEFFISFFKDSSDGSNFAKIFNNPNFNDYERRYIRSVLEKMGKL